MVLCTHVPEKRVDMLMGWMAGTAGTLVGRLEAVQNGFSSCRLFIKTIKTSAPHFWLWPFWQSAPAWYQPSSSNDLPAFFFAPFSFSHFLPPVPFFQSSSQRSSLVSLFPYLTSTPFTSLSSSSLFYPLVSYLSNPSLPSHS